LDKKANEWILKVATEADEEEVILPETVTMKLDWPEPKGAEVMKLEWEGIKVNNQKDPKP